MKIEVNRIHQGTGKIVAFCDVRIEIDKDLFFVEKGFRVVRCDDGHFMGLPAQKRADNKSYAHFLPSDKLKKEIEETVFASVLRYKPTDAKKLKEVALSIHEGLHNKEQMILDKNVMVYKDGDVRSVEIMGYKFITQNTSKNNEWSELSKKGHKITWVKKNDKEWIARIVDGKYELL